MSVIASVYLRTYEFTLKIIFHWHIIAGFAFWLQSRLVRIYASPRHLTHHKKAVCAHSAVLRALKELDSQAFVELVQRDVQLLAGMD